MAAAIEPEFIWTKEKTSLLIQLYELNTPLWDVSSHLYHNKNVRSKGHTKIAEELGCSSKNFSHLCVCVYLHAYTRVKLNSTRQNKAQSQGQVELNSCHM